MRDSMQIKMLIKQQKKIEKNQAEREVQSLLSIQVIQNLLYLYKSGAVERKIIENMIHLAMNNHSINIEQLTETMQKYSHEEKV